MADVYSKKKRSQIMAKIRGKGTSVEVSLARILRDLGHRPIPHYKDLPGSPDFVLPDHKVAIFTNGCFWHGHRNCPRAALPSTNKAFWRKKISANKRRDERQRRLLRKLGWHVLIFWTCKKITPDRVRRRLRLVGIS